MRISLAVLVLCVVGCGGGDDEPLFPELEMLDTTPDPACRGTWVAGVTGRIVDQRGAGISGAFPQMCVRAADGNFNCLLPEAAAESGFFGQVIAEDSRCMDELNFRVFLPNQGLGTTYCRAQLLPTDGILRVDDPLILYDVAPATELPPEGDPETARTVIVADGLEIDVTPAPLFGMYGELGGARVDAATCFADASFDGLYALTPEARSFRSTDDPPGFAFRIPTDLPDGTAVDLFVLGGLDELALATGTRLREGAFERFGTGRVVDGMVVNDAGSELPYLSWLGYRSQ